MPKPPAQPPENRSASRLLLLLLFAGALAVRLLYLYQLGDFPLLERPHMDEAYHLELVQQILSAGGLPAEPYFRAPLYPYLLAGLYSLTGGALYWIRIIQIILGSFLPLLVFGLGRRFFDRRVALVAGITAALYPTFWYYDASLLITSLMTLLCALVLWQAYRTEASMTAVNIAVLGGLIGLTALARPNILMFVPPLLVWYWVIGRPKLRSKVTLLRLALLAGMTVLVILPVTIRNYAVSGEFVPIAWQGGFNFYLGNNQEATGWSATAPGIDMTWRGGYRDAIRIAETDAEGPLPKSEVSGYWYGRTLDEITDDPAAFVGRLFRKTAFVFNGYEIPNNQNLYIVCDYSWLARIGLWPGPVRIPFGILSPLALLGLALSIPQWRRYMLLYLLIGSYSLSLVLFFVCARFRQPIIPVLILFAALAALRIVDLLRNRDYRNGVFLIFAACVLGLLTNLHIINLPADRVEAENHFVVGTILLEDNYIDRATLEFRKAISVDSTFAPAMNNLGLIYGRRNEHQRAIGYFARALAWEPSSIETYINLAAAHSSLGQYDDARAVLEQARRIQPQNDAVHFRLGLIFLQLGEADSAGVSFKEALRLNPDNAQARQALMSLRETGG